MSSRGTRQCSDQAVFGQSGVVRLRRMHLGPPPATGRKPVGEPDAGNPHVRFDERGRETGPIRLRRPEHPRPSSTLPTWRALAVERASPQ